MKSIRLEIREAVDLAKRRGQPITSRIIWGLLEREVPEDSFINILSSMCGSNQLTKVAGDGKGSGKPSCYQPGSVEVHAESRTIERHSKSLGFMARKRLMSARADAKKWLAGQQRRAA